MSNQIKYYSFNGGLNEKDKGLMLEDTEISAGKNVEIYGNAIRKRNGFTKLNGTTVGATTTQNVGMFTLASTRYAFAASGGSVYKMDYTSNRPDGTWDSIGSSLDTTAKWSYAALGSRMMLTNGVNEPYSWNGSGNIATLASLSSSTARPTLAKFVNTFGFRTFFSNVSVAYPAILIASLDGLDNDIKYTAVTAGVNGNYIKIAYASGGDTGVCSSAVTGSGTAGDPYIITVTYYANSKTANDVRSAVLANASATALVYPELDIGNNGTGYVTTLSATALAGGAAAAPYPFATIWSEFDDPLTYSVINIKFWSPDGSNGITSQFTYKDKGYVSTSKSIHQITYVGASASYVPFIFKERVVKNIGVAANKSVVEINGYILFLGSDKRMYAFDGYDATPVSDKITTTLDALNATIMDRIECVYYAKNNQLVMTYNTGTADTTSVILTADVTGFPTAPIKWNPVTDIPACSIALLDYDSSQILVGGSSTANGFVFQLDNGTNDNGAAISANFTTKLIANGLNAKKESFFVDLWVKGQSTPNNLTLYSYIDGDSTAISTLTLSQVSSHSTYNISDTLFGVNDYKTIQLKFENNSIDQPFEIYLAGLVDIDQRGSF